MFDKHKLSGCAIILLLTVAVFLLGCSRADAYAQLSVKAEGEVKTIQPLEQTKKAAKVKLQAAQSRLEPDHPQTHSSMLDELNLEEPAMKSLGVFIVTAYCPCEKCCGIWSAQHPSRVGTDFVQRTKSGTIPTEGRTIGVDPDVIPLGTVVVIGGHPYIAEDTGTLIKGRVLDIFFESHQEAVEWGVKYLEIFVPEETT